MPIIASRAGGSASGFGGLRTFGAAAVDTGAMVALGMVQVGSSAQSTISFTSIPSTYKHLQIRGIMNTSGGTNPTYGFNSDTGSNYAGHHLWGTGSTPSSNAQGPSIIYFNYNPSASFPSTFVMDILDYASTTKNKTVRILAGSDTNGGTAEIALWSGLWMNSSTAISSVQLYGNGVNFTQYTSVALYGIKGA